MKAEHDSAKGGLDLTGQVAAGEQAAATSVVSPKAQRSFTDPDARIMKTSHGSFHYCSNAQTVVDEGSQVILSTKLVATAGIEQWPQTLLADAGYFSESNVAADTEGFHAKAPDGPHIAHQEGPGGLRQTQSDRGTGLLSDESHRRRRQVTTPRIRQRPR